MRISPKPIMQSYKSKLKKIRAFAFDVDGVLTNGEILCLPSTGDLVRSYDAKDGLGMRIAFINGYKIAIITGGASDSILKRFFPTLAHEVYMGMGDKAPVFMEFCSKYNLDPSEVLYVGDDLPDIPVLKICGLAVCPSDAVVEVKRVCDYISEYPGGRGCVRDIIEQVLRSNDKWSLNPEVFHKWRQEMESAFKSMYKRADSKEEL